MVNDLNPDRAFRVVQDILDAGGTAKEWQADVANRFQAAALIEAARDAFGRVDIMINTAGVLKPGAMHQLDEWDWRRVLDVNLTGTFFCTQLMGRVMAQEGGGCIVNVVSGLPMPDSVSYATTQAGILGMTRQSARELGEFGVRVNALCGANLDGEKTPNNALRRSGTDEDVAKAALFLCSEAARFISGQVIYVDGGQV
jgi:3-oxoacyl-[acyl-carrier protein] reductase